MTVEEYFLPRSLNQAVELAAEHQDSLLVIAGGTVAMPLINEGVSVPEKVMGLRHAGLDTIKESKDHVTLGATTSLSRLLDLKSIPILQEAARHTGAWTTRNLGTVGGNLFVPPPAGDVAVALLALDAQVKLVSVQGERTLPLIDFFTGFMSNAMRVDELLAEIYVPVRPGRTAFFKVGRKGANTPAVVTVAISLKMSGTQVNLVRIALGAVGPHPIRAYRAESYLTGGRLTEDAVNRAAELAAEESQPFTDAVATEWYRRRMVRVYVGRALNQIMNKEA